MQGHTGAVVSVAFSPRKGELRLVTGSGDCSVRVWREVPGGGWFVLCVMSAFQTALDARAEDLLRAYLNGAGDDAADALRAFAVLS